MSPRELCEYDVLDVIYKKFFEYRLCIGKLSHSNIRPFIIIKFTYSTNYIEHINSLMMPIDELQALETFHEIYL
jgi:hypothetical protein